MRIRVTKKAARLLRKHAIETRLRARVLNPGASARSASYPVRVLRIKQPLSYDARPPRARTVSTVSASAAGLSSR